MRPVKFKGSNIVFAENQPEYLPLPAFRCPVYLFFSCGELLHSRKRISKDEPFFIRFRQFSKK